MKFIKDERKREVLTEYAYGIAGALLYAIGFNLLIVPLGLYSTGFMGAAQLLDWLVRNLIGISVPSSVNLVGILFYASNIPLFYVAYKVMSKEFMIRSLIIVSVLSGFLVLIPIPTTPIISDYLTASILGGIIGGIGAGYILCGRMAGGGQDIIGVCCAKKYPGFSVGKVGIAINGFVYACCLFIYNIEVVVYSLIFAVAVSLAMDRVHVRNINMSVMIFTKKQGIDNAIMSQMRRGVTKWEGEGAYTKEGTEVLYVIISKYEIPHIKKIVHDADPSAFVIINEGCSVVGNFEKRL